MWDFVTSNSSVFYFRKEIYDDIKDYREDYKKVIKQRETARIQFKHQSPQITERKNMVEFIKKVCQDKSLSQGCLHLAVYLLDIFMDNHNITLQRLPMVSCVCLMIAAKVEENTVNVPKRAEMSSYLPYDYSIEDHTSLERLVLKFFDFYVLYPTAAHYVYYYIQEAVNLDDLIEKPNFRELVYELSDAVRHFLNHAIDDVHYTQCYSPSKLAAAVLAASRIKVGLKKWSVQLEDLTEYMEDDLDEIVNPLICGKILHCQGCQAAVDAFEIS